MKTTRMKRPIGRFHPFGAVALLFAAATGAYGQWQKIGKEQLPSNLGNTAAESIRANDATGLALKDDAGNLGVFVEDGGEVGVGTNAPGAALEVKGLAVFGAIARIQGIADSADTYHRLVIDCPLDEDSQISFMDNNSTKWSAGNDGGTDGFVIRKGSGAFGTNDYLSIDTSGNLFLMGDTVGRLAFEPTSNEFRFGSSNLLQIDADNGNTNSSGALDYAGSGEFGSASTPLTFYQAASSFQTSDNATYLYSDDTVHAATADDEIHVALPCPWPAPGTRIASVKFLFHVGDNSDYVNVSVKRQTSATPGTTNDVVAFGGANYTRVSGLTAVTGNYYSRTGTANTTLAANEKVWAVVRLYSDSTANSCRLVGIEWTFEQRKY